MRRSISSTGWAATTPASSPSGSCTTSPERRISKRTSAELRGCPTSSTTSLSRCRPRRSSIAARLAGSRPAGTSLRSTTGGATRSTRGPQRQPGRVLPDDRCVHRRGPSRSGRGAQRHRPGIQQAAGAHREASRRKGRSSRVARRGRPVEDASGPNEAGKRVSGGDLLRRPRGARTHRVRVGPRRPRPAPVPGSDRIASVRSLTTSRGARLAPA
jgi:hypothetical protein